MNKKKKIVRIVLLVILVVVLLFAIGLGVFIFCLKSFEPIEFNVTADPEPLREFIVDTFEELLPKN